MQLSVKDFYSYRPASQWAFSLEFSDISTVVEQKSESGTEYVRRFTNTLTLAERKRISQAVVSVTQPKYKIEADTKSYGNFDFTVPKYDTNDLQITVTFEETDDLLISHKLIGSLMGNILGHSSPAWLNVHPTIELLLIRNNSYALDMAKPTHILLKGIENASNVYDRNFNALCDRYVATMAAYTEPTYERTSESPSAATCTITFLLKPYCNEISTALVKNDDSYVDSIVTPSKVTAANTLDKLIKVFGELSLVWTDAVDTASAALRWWLANYRQTSFYSRCRF